ncbi:MAG: AMP-binding protein, partial [Thermodesulfobacteriota bacterium]
MNQNGKPDNLVEMIEASVAAFPDHPLFGTKNPKGEYEWMTYRVVGERIDHLRGGLAQAGVGRGDWVGIIADNRSEWAIAAFAAYGLGARFVPMYEKELPRIWQYIIQDSGIKVLLVAKPEIQDRVEGFRDALPDLAGIYRIDGGGESSMAELERIGRDHPVPSIHPLSEDIAVLIYTSGTTGNPKG